MELEKADQKCILRYFYRKYNKILETFGNQYFQLLERSKISPDTRVPVKFIKGDDNIFIMNRYRQVHDLLHLLLNAPTNFEGESAVKGIDFKNKTNEKKLILVQSNALNEETFFSSEFFQFFWSSKVIFLKHEHKFPMCKDLNEIVYSINSYTFV